MRPETRRGGRAAQPGGSSKGKRSPSLRRACAASPAAASAWTQGPRQRGWESVKCSRCTTSGWRSTVWLQPPNVTSGVGKREAGAGHSTGRGGGPGVESGLRRLGSGGSPSTRRKAPLSSGFGTLRSRVGYITKTASFRKTTPSGFGGCPPTAALGRTFTTPLLAPPPTASA